MVGMQPSTCHASGTSCRLAGDECCNGLVCTADGTADWTGMGSCKVGPVQSDNTPCTMDSQCASMHCAVLSATMAESCGFRTASHEQMPGVCAPGVAPASAHVRDFAARK